MIEWWIKIELESVFFSNKIHKLSRKCLNDCGWKPNLSWKGGNHVHCSDLVFRLRFGSPNWTKGGHEIGWASVTSDLDKRTKQINIFKVKEQTGNQESEDHEKRTVKKVSRERRRQKASEKMKGSKMVGEKRWAKKFKMGQRLRRKQTK